MKRLIVNADDCNLTRGVTEGILKAHEEGIVTSTTVLINLPLEEHTLRELKKRRGLGLGLHLNVTLGEPVNLPSEVSSLVRADGRFRRPNEYQEHPPAPKDLLREYEAQVRLFVKDFGRKPDHLDTHHHLHDFPVFFQVLAQVAKRWKLPIRRSHIFQIATHGKLTRRLKTTDYLFGNLQVRYPWRWDPFLSLMEHLPEGTSEIACHPGFKDARLRKISSLVDSREVELNLLSSKRLRKEISRLGIELVRFSEI